ncbi:50S ribosomal protein L25 [Salsipaludibacter albus]|uniref:50S ribosomal protein L25 n=1 Tax=Salsipaludibacter albus TaxID=2849650 RepID=UPI001EE3A2D9|nr:50S ribosomal protein L25 [Salsipaludibacter albus]MBY5161932.1 50S ribosomal protein L25 [Salsipaludibacter albus]
MASKQIELTASTRTKHGKGASGRLRKTGRVPGIVYGHGVEPTALDVDALQLYHALHTDAGRNVLIRLEVEGETHLSIVKDLQRHAVRGDVMHVDFQAVSRDQQITAEIPVHLANEEDPRQNGGIINLVLYTVPLRVRPLEVPQEFVLDLAGTEIGDVRRMSDLADQLPEGAEFELEDDVTIVTITAPMSEEELDELAEGAGIEEDQAEPELVAEGDEPAEGGDEAEGGADAEGDGDADE